MIAWIRVRGLGVLDDVEINFGAGFNVITGESGAGKSMILRAIYLLLGAKADPGLIRDGHERIEVDGAFSLPEGPLRRRVQARLADAGVDWSAEEDLIVSRTVAREGGRGRAVIHGRTVPVSVLSDVAAELAVVHGQGEQVRLLHPARQRDALDAFAGATVLDALAGYRSVWARAQQVERQLHELVTNAQERAREADLLRFGVAEIEQVQPSADEEAALAAEAALLSHTETLRELTGTARQALSAEDDLAGADALTAVGAAEAAAAKAGAIDSALAGVVARIREARVLLEDASAELASYAASIDADPERLAQIQDRQAALAGLRRKYGESIAEVLAWCASARDRLAGLDTDETSVGELRAEHAQLTDRLHALAEQISAGRQAAAQRLGVQVSEELRQLAMPKARLEVRVAAAERLGPHGGDDVVFELAAHERATARPVAKAASGGELSRIMLALEVVLASLTTVPTMLFDEVDAGVGGDAARALAARLAAVSSASQIIVVTHLAQVAVAATHHLALLDTSREADLVRVLVGQERVDEVARMLAGDGAADEARAHAQVLVQQAAQGERSGQPRRA